MKDYTGDNGRKQWYADGLEFECRRCGACCGGESGYVWVTRAEIEKIARHLKMSFDDFARKHLRRVGRKFSLREKPNGDCCLLEGGCRVYPVRPRQCVSWPFWAENLESRAVWPAVREDCPGAGQGRLFSAREIDEISNGDFSPLDHDGKICNRKNTSR